MFLHVPTNYAQPRQLMECSLRLRVFLQELTEGLVHDGGFDGKLHDGDSMLCFADIHAEFKGRAEFDWGNSASKGGSACLSRMAQMQGMILKFCEQVRVEEGIISKAQVQGLREGENVFNFMMSELNKAKQYSKLRAGRASRMATWMTSQEALKASCCDASEKNQPLSVIDICRPVSSPQCQFVIFRRGTAVITYEIGMVLSLYRGALCKNPGTSRRMSLSKPLSTAAPANVLAKVRALVMQKVDENVFVASALCDQELVEVENLCAEIAAEEEGIKQNKLYVSFKAESVQAFKALVNGSLVFGSDDKKSKKHKTLEHGSEEDFKGYTIKSFTRNDAGEEQIKCLGCLFVTCSWNGIGQWDWASCMRPQRWALHFRLICSIAPLHFFW